MRFDLHIHSALSTCADRDMAPRAIVRRACAAGLDGIALCDHNSARNAPALRDACAAEGLYGLYGLEITTVETLHALAIFDTPETALAMTEKVYAALPDHANEPEIFGEQRVFDSQDRLQDVDWHLLGMPTILSVQMVAAAVRALGGVLIASHVDRPEFSVSSQLGTLRGDEGFDAMEVTRQAERALWRQRYPGLPVVCSSDAHRLCEIGLAWNEANLPDFSVASLREVFAKDSVHCVTP